MAKLEIGPRARGAKITDMDECKVCMMVMVHNSSSRSTIDSLGIVVQKTGNYTSIQTIDGYITKYNFQAHHFIAHAQYDIFQLGTGFAVCFTPGG